MDRIELDEVGRLIRGRMGLIIGPGLTLYGNGYRELSEHLARVFSVPRAESFIKTCDRAIEGGTRESEVQQAIRDYVNAQKPCPILSGLCKTRWAAAFSASLDTFFEEQLGREYDQRLVGRAVTVIGDLTIPPPPRSVPVYKLLGVGARSDFAFSTAGYVRRRVQWRTCVKAFADHVKDNPVLCVGMSDCRDILYDLMAEVSENASCAPRALLILADDALAADEQLRHLVTRHPALIVVEGSVGDVARAAVEQERSRYSTAIPLEPDKADRYAALRQYSDLAVVVNEHIDTTTSAAEKSLLHDVLFSPSAPRWDPFAYDLDFRRTLEEKLETEIKTYLREKGIGSGAFVLRGNSAAGKTTLLKRIAYNTAKTAEPTVWLKPWFYQESYRVVLDFFTTAKNSRPTPPAGPIVAFLDDPLTFGTLSPREIVNAAEHAGVDLFLVIGVRNSDWASQDRAELLGNLPILMQEELSDNLDDREWAALPEYLVRLEAAQSPQEAQSMLRGLETQHARDTLCMLYWLLPETKAHIARSIRDEFFRLGDMAALTRVIVGTATHTTNLLKRAYEMVAVANRFGTPLPVEVLVTALGVDYDEWLDAAGSGGPAWGLLYAEESQSAETILYRTRNQIVTNTIVQTVNGGSLGHSGELRVMSELLRSCTGTQPVYREFCIRVLVPHDNIQRFDYPDGIRLYEEALGALPYPDKTLLHHKALWIKNKGQDPFEAGSVLAQALETRSYPYAERGEADQHIHCSMAATILDAVDQGKMTIEDGKPKVLNHLEQARSEGFFSARPVHVQANLILRLADKFEETQTTDFFGLLNEAMADVDRTLRLMCSPVAKERHKKDDVSMLETIRGKLLARLRLRSPEELRAEAERIWKDYNSQQGFLLACWQAYHDALERGRGRMYHQAFLYFEKCIREIKARGEEPLGPLQELGAYIYYEWQVRRRIMTGGGDPIRWSFLRETTEAALRSRALSNDTYCKYIHALSLAHLADWPNAIAILERLRGSNLPRYVVWAPRDYLLYSGGGVRRVQGVMKYGPSGPYVFVEDFHTDFRAVREGIWPKRDEIVHVYLRFSFGGVFAVDRP